MTFLPPNQQRQSTEGSESVCENVLENLLDFGFAKKLEFELGHMPPAD